MQTRLFPFILLVFFAHFGVLKSNAQSCNLITADSPNIHDDYKSNYVISGKRITNLNGPCIVINQCHNVRIENCVLGPSLGEAIAIYGSTNVTIVNCSFEGNSTGVLAQDSYGIRINNNKFTNAQGPSQPNPKGQFVQFNRVRASYTVPATSPFFSNEISYNVGENVCGISDPEDMISLVQSCGTASYPIIVRGNKLRGGGPSKSGGGIMAGDSGGSYTIIQDNVVVNPGNYGIAISGGTNHSILNNKIYARNQCHKGWQPDCDKGLTQINGFCGDVGIYVDGFSTPCSGHTVKQNQITWYMANGVKRESGNTNGCSTVIGWNDSWANGGNDWTTSLNPSTLLPQDLVCPDVMAYYNFDNSLIDKSGAGLNGAKVGGGPNFICDGNFMSGNFDGIDDHVSLPKSSWLRPASNRITFTAWIKPDVTNRPMTIAHSQDGDGWADGWRVMLNNGQLNVRMVTKNGVRDLYCAGITGQQWNQVGFSYDGLQLKVYVNGALATSASLTGAIVYNAIPHVDNMRIGFSDGQNYFFDGKIDDVKFYRGILGTNSVLNEYNNSKGYYNNTVNDLPAISGTYTTDSQTRTLSSGNPVTGSANVSVTYPIGASYTWQLQSGSPSYWSGSGSSLYVSFNSNTSATFLVTASTACGSTSLSLVFYNTGSTAAYSIYPNPASSSLIIERNATDQSPMSSQAGNRSPVVFDAKLYDKFQKVVKTGKARDGKLNFNTSELPEGFYFLQLQVGEEATEIKRILIKK